MSMMERRTVHSFALLVQPTIPTVERGLDYVERSINEYHVSDDLMVDVVH